MTQQVGITSVIPILSAVATSRIASTRATEPLRDAVLGGVTFAVLVDAAVVVVGAVVIALFFRNRERADPATT